MGLEHIWESIVYVSNCFLELGMGISPSATWLDGFFIDIVLMLGFPIYPETRKDE
jgi:hypothetical protein